MGFQHSPHQQRDRLGAVSRRDLLKGATAIAAAGSVPVLAQLDRRAPIFAYVGAYTPNGQGIHIFSLNPSTGDLTPVKVVPSASPSWIAFDPTKKFLYAGNEIDNFNNTTTGSVTAYSVNPTTGDLKLLNVVTSGGAGPAHVSVDPKGAFVFVANYGGGNVAVLPIDKATGKLMNPSDIVADNTACSPACPLGPIHAAKAPPGSFAISGHDAPHAHMIETDPTGNYVIAQDLGLDLTIVWALNRTTGKLSNHQTVPSSAGAGPRHFAFHPYRPWFYSLNEEASTLAFMTWDAAKGMLTPHQEVSTLPAGFKGTSFTSEVILSPNGRFVYCLNRLHNSIARLAIDGTGHVTLVGQTWTRADYPRNCAIDPTGNFMYVSHNRSDNVTTFRVNPGNGSLHFTGEFTAVGSPAVVAFLG